MAAAFATTALLRQPSRRALTVSNFPSSKVRFESLYAHASLPGNAQSVKNLEIPVVEEEEAEGEDEWYKVLVHKMAVRDQQKGVTQSFFVPEGYGLLCISYPLSDIEVEAQDKDKDRDNCTLELAVANE